MVLLTIVVQSSFHDEENIKSDHETKIHRSASLARRLMTVSTSTNKTKTETNSIDSAERTTTSDNNSNADGIFDELLCLDLLQNVSSEHQWDPNEGRLYLRLTKEEPQFWISLHQRVFDPVRYGTLLYGKYYEQKLSQAFTEILLLSPDENNNKKNTIVLDVGGNIGWFSLLTAALGYDVHVFEPSVIHTIRLCESLCLNGWMRDISSRKVVECPTLGSLGTARKDENNQAAGQVYIRRLGLSNQTGMAMLLQDESAVSPGAAKIVTSETTTTTSGLIAKTLQQQQELAEEGEEDGESILLSTLDDFATHHGWLNSDNNDTSKPDIAILKIDVEGHENHVFLGGLQLIQSHLIRNIFLEGNVRNEEEASQFLHLAQLLRKAGYGPYRLGGGMGPQAPWAPRYSANNSTSMGKGSSKNASFLVEDLLWACRGYDGRRRNQCNIWMKRESELQVIGFGRRNRR